LGVTLVCRPGGGTTGGSREGFGGRGRQTYLRGRQGHCCEQRHRQGRSPATWMQPPSLRRWSFGAIGEDGLRITSPPKRSIKCEKAITEGHPFPSSSQGRLRSRGRNRKPSCHSAQARHGTDRQRFEIDQELSLSTVDVQTDVDMDVYHALSYADNSLANIYYKQSRGVPFQELQKDQLDSMMCAAETKFALTTGELLRGDPAAS